MRYRILTTALRWLAVVLILRVQVAILTNYPDYFPQAKSNPQDMNVYPVAALPEFRVWLQTEYIPKKFPSYLKGKVKDGILPPSAAELLLSHALPPALAPKKIAV